MAKELDAETGKFERQKSQKNPPPLRTVVQERDVIQRNFEGLREEVEISQ